MGTLRVTGPLTASLRGLWVSGLLLPDNGGPYQRAATLEPAKSDARGLTRSSQAGIPKRMRPNCHSCPKEVLTYQRGWYLCTRSGGAPKTPLRTKGNGPKDPGVAAPLAAAGCCGNCYYDTGGRSLASARIVILRLTPSQADRGVDGLSCVFLQACKSRSTSCRRHPMRM